MGRGTVCPSNTMIGAMQLFRYVIRRQAREELRINHKVGLTGHGVVGVDLVPMSNHRSTPRHKLPVRSMFVMGVTAPSRVDEISPLRSWYMKFTPRKKDRFDKIEF